MNPILYFLICVAIMAAGAGLQAWLYPYDHEKRRKAVKQQNTQ